MEAQIKRSVAYVAANADKLSLEELKSVYAEAQTFILSLPPEKRGAFYWHCSGLECLAMLIEPSDDDTV